MREPKESSAVVVGVAGGSGSGKTTFARHVARDSGDAGATLLAMDRFYLSQAERPAEVADNFDHPSAIDFDLLENALRNLRCGTAAAVPRYDYASHDRVGFETLSASKLIILEGIFSLWHSEIRSQIDFAVYVETPVDVRLRRRLDRDMRERGRDRQSVETQWTTTVLPMHERHVAPTKCYANQVVNGDACFDSPVRQLVGRLGLGRPAVS